MTARTLHAASLALPCLVLSASALAQATVAAKIVYKEGDAVAGTTISSTNTPFTDGTGRMASIVITADARRIILDEDLAVIFDSGTIAAPVLTGAEGTIGFGSTNSYIYSPSIDSVDGVFANGGVLARGTEPAPDTAGEFFTFASRPTMIADGTAFWSSGLTATSGGSATRRALYRNATPGVPANSEIVIQGGDVYGGLTVNSATTFFEYGISDNQLHRIHQLTALGLPAANDVYVAVDDVLVAQEGMPAPVGNFTSTMRMVSINNSGTWVFAGDTTFTPTTGDEIIMSNSGMVLQEGTVIDGLALAGTVNGLSINNNNDVVFTWGTGATEALFLGPVASLAADAQKLLQVNDLLDVDNDGTGDYTVIDFEASAAIGPGFSLADDGRVFVEVTIRPIGGTSTDDLAAILRFPFDEPGCPADLDNGSGTGIPDGGVDINDLLYFLTGFEAGSVSVDLDNGTGTGTPDGGVDINDLLFFLARFEAGC